MADSRLPVQAQVKTMEPPKQKPTGPIRAGSTPGWPIPSGAVHLACKVNLVRLGGFAAPPAVARYPAVETVGASSAAATISGGQDQRLLMLIAGRGSVTLCRRSARQTG